MISKYHSNGQTRVCADRLYVQADIYDAFAARLNVGLLISGKALTKVEENMADAVPKGATVTLGGKRNDKGGLLYWPTMLTGVTSDMKVAREETCGPVAPLFRIESEEEVIVLANNTEFDLACYFYSRDMSKVFR